MKKEIVNVVTDFDGIFTTTFFAYDEHGKKLKFFSVNDVLMLQFLHDFCPEIKLTILSSKQPDGLNKARAEYYMKVHPRLTWKTAPNKDKYKWMIKNFPNKDVVYIGDDIFDVPIARDFRTYTTMNAPDILKRYAHTVLTRSGESSFTDIMIGVLEDLEYDVESDLCEYVTGSKE